MPDHWKEGDDVFVDFSGDNRANAKMRDAAQRTRYNNTDLASGYPESLIWTTKDGQRIAIPNLADSHLLNILAFLRRRVENYKKQILAELAKGIIQNLSIVMLFDVTSKDEARFESANEEIKREAQRIINLSDDEFLREFVPKHALLYREAYERKLLIEVDKSKLTNLPNHAIEKDADWEDSNWGDN